jgi:hypothetical protein
MEGITRPWTIKQLLQAYITRKSALLQGLQINIAVYVEIKGSSTLTHQLSRNGNSGDSGSVFY